MNDAASPDAERNAPSRPPFASPRLWVMAGLVFISLIAGYWFFIRTAYEPVLTNVSAQDATDIVKVLEERKIPYRLADGGRTILVASDNADMARIELAGSELAMRGQVGFELFNQSDMGLTEFAQKVNYQRALQGELARTILLLDGIAAVRVHLGLPERGIFRDEQAQPKASITLILKPGTTLTEGTVRGVQRLVAGAIPEMRVDSASVLDGTGRIVSPEAPTTAPLSDSDAVLEHHRRQIVQAIGRAHPSLRYGLNVSLRQIAARPTSDGQADSLPAGEAAAPGPRGDPDFSVNVRITTPARLDDGIRLELISLVEQAVGFDRRRGDSLLFLVGDVLAAEREAAPPIVTDRIVAKAAEPTLTGSRPLWLVWWPLAALAASVILLAAWLRDRRRSTRRGRQQLLGFTEQLRERLRVVEGTAG